MPNTTIGWILFSILTFAIGVAVASAYFESRIANLKSMVRLYRSSLIVTKAEIIELQENYLVSREDEPFYLKDQAA